MVILINNYFTEIDAYSQIVEISRNKSLGRKQQRGDRNSQGGCCLFSFLKYIMKFKEIMAEPQNHHC